MAVAVKNSDARTQGTSAAVQALSLLGLFTLLVALAVVFWVIPMYGPGVLASAGIVLTPYLQAALLGTVMLVAAGVLFWWLGGETLLGTSVVGVRAGIFISFAALFGILLVGAWFGGIMEWLTFDKGWFGSNGKMVGAITTGVFAGVLLLLFLRWFFSTGTTKWLVGLEEGGWFSWTSYKPLQGNRVRRGTIIALLMLGGSGVYTLVSTNFLARFQQTTATKTEAERLAMTEAEKQAEARKPVLFDGWTVGIPFTGTLTLRHATEAEKLKGETGPFGDGTDLLADKAGWNKTDPITVDRWVLRDQINANLDPGRYVYLNLDIPADFDLKNGLMSRNEFQTALDNMEAAKRNRIDEVRDTRDPVPTGNPSGRKDRERLYTSDGNKFVTLAYTPVPLLPHVRFTVPLLLLALTLWLAWRIVNYPPFADFLIATESEMNKVSWTTRKRLFQDTIVVLVTLMLMAGFLLIVDLTCKSVLGNEWVGVIKMPAEGSTGKKNAGNTRDLRPW